MLFLRLEVNASASNPFKRADICRSVRLLVFVRKSARTTEFPLKPLYPTPKKPVLVKEPLRKFVRAGTCSLVEPCKASECLIFNSVTFLFVRVCSKVRIPAFIMAELPSRFAISATSPAYISTLISLC